MIVPNFRRALCRAVALLPLVGLAFVTTSSTPAYAVSQESAEVQDWFDDMEAYFNANPDLKTTPGSGWKPYNRERWFVEQRMQDGELPSATARWDVWQDKQARFGAEQSRAGTWFALGPENLAGRMLAIDFDPVTPSTVYSGAADGGVWKSIDSGATWIPMSDELPSLAIGGLAVSKTDSDIIVIGTGEGTNNIDRVGGVGILRSTDAGVTWLTTDMSLGVASGHGFHVVRAGTNGTFLAGGTDGLYRSSDDGATWTQVRVDGDYYDVVWKPGDANTVYTIKGNDSVGNNVKQSTDDGITWTKKSNGLPLTFSIGKSKLAVTADNPQVVYALIGDPGGSSITGLYKTSDDAANWSTQTTSTGLVGGQIWYNLMLAADPNDEATVIAGGVSIARSINSGVNFSSIGGVHSDHHAIAYEPGADNTLLVGGDGGIYRSTNDGASFTYRSTNLNTYQFYDICVNNGPDPYYIFGGTQDNGSDKWTGTTTWSQGLFADGMVCYITAVSGTKVYAEIQNGQHYRNNASGVGGWTSINSGLTGNGDWVTAFAGDDNLGAHVYTSTTDGVFRSLNSGNNWTNVASHSARWISVSPIDGNTVWTVTGIPYYTTDDGGSWTMTSAFPFTTGGANKVLAHPNDVASAFVVFGSYGSSVAHVAMTTDYGVNWTDVSGDFPAVPANTIVVNPSDDSQWFAGTDVGVWMSDNGGVNWTPFDGNLPNVVVEDLEIKDSLQKLVAGTHGRGAWEAEIPPSGVTDVAVEVELPRNLMLDPPSPNPVTDRTMLRFAARHDGPVTLDIFDVQGRRVASLDDFARGDGVIRTTPWYTDDVPAGVYFAVLRAGQVSRSQKIVVTR